ncbi:hypothetical protein GCM10027062_16110 [Nocardioides hungaricus]
MTDERRLSETLHRIVPTPPDRPERRTAVAERVRRHRRRTAATTVAVAAVVVGAVVGAAVAVPAALSGADGDADPVATTPTTQASELTCPPTDQRPTGPGTLPAGATAVRLCQGPGTPFDAPADALTTDVDRVVELVNAQPELERGTGCELDFGTGYQLAFAYEGGETRTVAGRLYGCRDLQVGSVTRTNPEAPYRLFVRLLRAQRATLDPPDTPGTTPSCELGGTSPVARPGEMTTAVLCVRYQTVSELDPLPVPVSPDDLRVLLTDRVPAPPNGPYNPDAPTLLLVGETAWGDRVYRIMSDPGRLGPGPDARRILDRLVAEAGTPRPTVDESSSPSEVVAAYVDLLDVGDRTGAAALWSGPADLPELYSEIGYKEERMRFIRTTAPGQVVAEVVALYREQVRDAYTPYRRATFRLVLERGGYRIREIKVGEAVATGR